MIKRVQYVLGVVFIVTGVSFLATSRWLDAGWGVFLTILAHKAESAGRELIAVNPASTSRTCARCGHSAQDNRVTQADFACTACGHTAHADENAAVNILRAGLALQAAQAA